MRNSTLFIMLCLLATSCGSDNLTNSKAEKIISACLESKPELRTSYFAIGKATFKNKDYDNDLLGKYTKLVEDGYLEMELVQEFSTGWRKGTKEYNIKLTEDALEYMEEVPENGNQAIAKAFRYVVDEVLEVQEIPSLNTAKVKIQYKAADITPFSVFSRKDPKEFWIDNITVRKTSNGWKYCDTF